MQLMSDTACDNIVPRELTDTAVITFITANAYLLHSMSSARCSPIRDIPQILNNTIVLFHRELLLDMSVLHASIPTIKIICTSFRCRRYAISEAPFLVPLFISSDDLLVENQLVAIDNSVREETADLRW